MTKHELTFSKIKELLESNFPKMISEFENGTHLTLNSENEDESPIWIELDEGGMLTVGIGAAHKHFYPNIDNLNEGFNEFLHFLTCKKKRTDFYKGESQFKSIYYYELKNGTFKNYGTVSNLNLSFWKKITEKTITQNGFVEYEEIESEIDNIKSTMHNNAYILCLFFG